MKNILTLLALLNTFLGFSQNDNLGLENWSKGAQNRQQGFIANKGQIGDINNNPRPEIKAMYKSGNLTIFLLPTGLAYQFCQIRYPEGYNSNQKFVKNDELVMISELSKRTQIETYRMDMELIGANSNCVVTMEGMNKTYYNYYNVPWNKDGVYQASSYNTVTYHNIYPGIDWVIYTNGNELKYDFVVNSGANPKLIKFHYLFNEKFKIESDGSLKIENRMGNIVEHTPKSYQEGKQIYTNFELNNGIISFKIGHFKSQKKLVIDPLINWATYFGGSLTDNCRFANSDKSQNVYIVGETASTSAISSGGYQTSIGGDFDAYLAKFNSAGTLQWATYYGNNGFDVGTSCCTDTNSNVFLVGHTLSSSMASSGHQNTIGGSNDAFLVKFNSAGARQWATYYGGSNADYGTCCVTDDSSNVFLSGYTYSTNAISYKGHQSAYAGNCDAFAVKFNSSGVRQWATYYGGNAIDNFINCKVDNKGNSYFSGETTSPSGIAYLGHQNAIGGKYDAYLVKFDINGKRIWGSYYGGLSDDYGFGCAIDKNDNIYLGGSTSSSDSISFKGYQDNLGGGSDDFLVKFNANGVRKWASYFGGEGNESVGHCVVAPDNSIFLGGTTSSLYDISRGGVQDTLLGSSDLFLSYFSATGNLVFASYYGGSGSEGGGVMTYGDSNNIYLSGTTLSPSKASVNGYQNSFGGVSDALLVKINISNIIIDQPSKTSFQQGDTFSVGFSTNTLFKKGNTFRLEISNGSGDFKKPIIIGKLESDKSGTIQAEVPFNLPQDCNYRLRIVADSLFMVGQSSIFTISVSSTVSNPGDYMVSLDGKDDYIDLGTWFNKKNFTLSFWVNPDSMQKFSASIANIQNDLVLYSNPTIKNNYILSHLLQFDMAPNKWNHFTITVDGSTNKRRVYLFGQLIDENTWTYAPTAGYNFKFGNGAFGPSSFFKGYIDEIKLWDTILSPKTIKDNVSGILNGNEANLLGYWNFNNGCSSVVPDLTSNHHDGLLKNGVLKFASTVPNIGQQIIPNKAGNTNISTIKIYDNLIQKGAKVRLTHASRSDILADTVIVNESGTIASCIFNLAGKDTGLYNIVLINPDTTLKIYENGFIIEEGKGHNLWLNIIGRNSLRNGRPYTCLITYGNKGDIDARGVPMMISFPYDSEITPKFSLVDINSKDSLRLDSVPLIFEIDTIVNGIKVKEKYIFLYFPCIPAGYSGELAFSIRYHGTPNSFNISAEMGKNFYNSPLDTNAIHCLIDLSFEALSIIPGFGCVSSIMDAFYKPVAFAFLGKDKFMEEMTVFNFAKGVGGMLLECSPAGSVFRSVRLMMKLTRIGKVYKNASQLKTILSESCVKSIYNNVINSSNDIQLVNSYDPNEKIGPNKYMRSNSPFSYTILFENKDSAKAPAQEVFVVDSLDKTKFDLKTFSFGNFGFGDTFSTSTYQYQKQFSKYIDLRPKTDLIVKIEGRLDTSTGVLYWKFGSLNPNTLELTEDPLLGFLPPNKKSPEGEGCISFTVNPIATLPTGTNIQNKASIVFDLNKPIITNSYRNIIDNIRPISNVKALSPIQKDSSFTVSWQGSDIGSGVRSYDIFVSEDTGVFKYWLHNSSSTSEVFAGRNNHTYRFYSISTDSASNIENDTIPIAATTVSANSKIRVLDYSGISLSQNYPNPFSSTTTFEFYTPNAMDATISILDVFGREVTVLSKIQAKQGTNTIVFEKKNLTSGLYFYQLHIGELTLSKMMIIN